MALVTELEATTKERQNVHRPTRCTYIIIEGPNGAKYLQLDTFGSVDRDIPDKVSQTIQFDRQAAGQLLQLIHQAFPDLATPEQPTEAFSESTTDDEEAEEGRRRFRLHRQIERKPQLVRRKKQITLVEKGCVACEVCEFDFAKIYGQRGHGFAECHHAVALGKLTESTKTRLSDLHIVCANCHRMLHRSPHFDVTELRELVLSLRGALAEES